MKPAEPDALRSAAKLLEAYMALGKPQEIKEKLAAQKKQIRELNMTIDRMRAHAVEKNRRNRP